MDDLNQDQYDLLDDAVDKGYIEEDSDEYELAVRCIEVGYDKLAPEDQRLYDETVAPPLAKLAAKRERQERLDGMPD